METKKILIAGLVVVVIIVAGVVIFSKKGSSPIITENQKDIKIQTVADAESQCDSLMTLEEIKTITGLAYSKRDTNGQTLNKIIVTTCTYSAPGFSATIKPISILTRLATNSSEANKIFEESKTASYSDGQPLTDLGEQALWSPMFGQVSVLQGKTWIIVGSYNNQVLATRIAKELVNKVK